MKYIFLCCLFLISCSGSNDGCFSDSDCKGDRVCQDGECVNLAKPNTSTGKGCGEISIQCNCAYNAGYPGQTVSTTLCQSGEHQFFQCPGSCGNGFPWGAQCYCN